MWVKLSEDIADRLKLYPTSFQCESRYKTLMRRKSFVDKNNRSTGASPLDNIFEEEIDAIKDLDDSVQPLVMRGVGKVLYKDQKENRESVQPERKRECVPKRKKLSSSDKIIKKLSELDENRERRHKEKMSLLRSIF